MYWLCSGEGRGAVDVGDERHGLGLPARVGHERRGAAPGGQGQRRRDGRGQEEGQPRLLSRRQ